MRVIHSFVLQAVQYQSSGFLEHQNANLSNEGSAKLYLLEAEEVCAAADMALTTRNSVDTCTLMIAVFVALSKPALPIGLEDNSCLKTVWQKPLSHKDKSLM